MFMADRKPHRGILGPRLCLPCRQAREDREMLLVTAPDWDAEQLEQWVTDWLTARIPELD